MNILTLTVTLIMAIAIITYARIEQFLPKAVINKEYREHMLFREHSQKQEIVKRVYNKKDDPFASVDEKKKNSKKLYKQVNIYILFDKKQFDTEKYWQTANLLKKLIRILYGNEKFFLQVQEKDPYLLESLIEAFVQYSFDEEKEKIASKELFRKIDLDNKILREEVLYKMFTGELPTKGRIETGYPSLLDFLFIGKKERKISIFKTKKEMLLALFEDEYIVEEIIKLRDVLGKQVENEEISSEEAEKELKERFINAGYLQEKDIITWEAPKKDKPIKENSP